MGNLSVSETIRILFTAYAPFLIALFIGALLGVKWK